MKAGELRIGTGASKLLEARSIQEGTRSPELRRATDFGEGQIAGPFGPQFVGWGEIDELSLWERWRATIGVAAGIAVGAFAIMAAR